MLSHAPPSGGTWLTDETVAAWDTWLQNRGTRVTAYTVGGTQVSLPGMLSFPGHWTAKQTLNSGPWSRHATQDELQTDSRWWCMLNFTPRAIVHGNGKPACDDDRIDLFGTHVTVLAQEAEQQAPAETYDHAN